MHSWGVQLTFVPVYWRLSQTAHKTPLESHMSLTPPMRRAHCVIGDWETRVEVILMSRGMLVSVGAGRSAIAAACFAYTTLPTDVV